MWISIGNIGDLSSTTEQIFWIHKLREIELAGGHDWGDR
jgi:hypothetical protein